MLSRFRSYNIVTLSGRGTRYGYGNKIKSFIFPIMVIWGIFGRSKVWVIYIM